jgi:SAM-dependent methyltransferase
MAAYNSSEFAWQGSYDPLEGLAEAPSRGAVLDLGCGSGQTIRRLFPGFGGALIGVDADSEILAYGSKLFSAFRLPGFFCRASAHALPFPDDTFDFIVCRGVISYTLQRAALSEAFRVLRPGALMFLRVESPIWDLRAITHPTGPFKLFFGLRSLAVGLVHDLTGLQAMPGGVLKGPRAYVSERRFRRIVGDLGGEVLRYESSPHGPQFLGRGTQDVVLCRKGHAA